MTESQILESLGEYIIKTLPDKKQTNNGMYIHYDALAEYSEERMVTEQEAMNLAAYNALQIFDELYKNKKFILYPGDNGNSTDYSQYIREIDASLNNLKDLETNILNALNSEDAEELITPYLFLDFDEEIKG
jgi:viroplasmin and RNaseH domain-containing protein